MPTIDPKKIEEWRRLSAQPPSLRTFERHRAAYAVGFLNAVPALLGEREEMLAVLRKIEWAGSNVGDEPACPICHEPCGFGAPGKHAPDCRLAALLKG